MCFCLFFCIFMGVSYFLLVCIFDCVLYTRIARTFSKGERNWENRVLCSVSTTLFTFFLYAMCMLKWFCLLICTPLFSNVPYFTIYPITAKQYYLSGEVLPLRKGHTYIKKPTPTFCCCIGHTVFLVLSVNIASDKQPVKCGSVFATFSLYIQCP